MINAFYSATSGALCSQSSIDVSANNIANVNTTGYKEQSAIFSEILYSNMANVDGATPQNLKTGNGVKLQDVAKVFNQGDVTETGRTLDVAIEGNGLFGVMDKKGNVSYTRAGNFSVANENPTNYLVTSNGDYVLDSNMKPIVLSDPISDVAFSSPTANTNVNDSTVKIGIFSFNNPYELTMQGDSKYKANNLSGKAVLDTNSTIKQGSLESSTVDLASEMTRIIQAQRAFQFNSKMIQVADEVEQMANTLRT
jgi:flagellar basal-body rod protein FlgG